ATTLRPVRCGSTPASRRMAAMRSANSASLPETLGMETNSDTRSTIGVTGLVIVVRVGSTSCCPLPAACSPSLPHHHRAAAPVTEDLREKRVALISVHDVDRAHSLLRDARHLFELGHHPAGDGCALGELARLGRGETRDETLFVAGPGQNAR